MEAPQSERNLPHNQRVQQRTLRFLREWGFEIGMADASHLRRLLRDVDLANKQLDRRGVILDYQRVTMEAVYRWLFRVHGIDVNNYIPHEVRMNYEKLSEKMRDIAVIVNRRNRESEML